MPFYLINTSTKAATRFVRQNRSARGRVLLLADQTLRLLPARPVLVSEAWLERWRASVFDLQEKGMLSVSTQDMVPIRLPAQGAIPSPPAPKRYTAGEKIPMNEPPEFFIGRGLFDLKDQRDQVHEQVAPQAWERIHPSEVAGARVRPPRVNETPDMAFPADMLLAEEGEAPPPAPPPPPPAIPQEMDDSDFAASLAEVAQPSFAADLPADMILSDDEAGAVEDEPMYSASEKVTVREIPPLRPAPAVPAPQPTETRGKNRRKR